MNARLVSFAYFVYCLLPSLLSREKNLQSHSELVKSFRYLKQTDHECAEESRFLKGGINASNAATNINKAFNVLQKEIPYKIKITIPYKLA